MTTRLEVDGPATGSSASTKGRSLELLLELLLTLHTLVGAAALQRTNECSSSGRARSALRNATASWMAACTRITAVPPSSEWSQQPLGRASVAAFAHV